MLEEKWFLEKVCARFLKYVRIDTTSDPASSLRPSTPGQLDLAALLEEELAALGAAEVRRIEGRYLIARIPPRTPDPGPYICFMAHLDTSCDVPGKGVVPVLHEEYAGTEIRLKNGVTLDPERFPELKRYQGDTIITADGTTLLGADDKAGIAEIMTALEYLLLHPELPHPGLEILYTTDEETGRGMDGFPLEELQSRFCYTFDGGEEGLIEIETFEAYRAEVSLLGRSIHPGKAFGQLINAVELMKTYLSLLPAGEKPETTRDRGGYYCPIEVSGSIESARISFIIRDFDKKECLRRLKVLEDLAGLVETAYPGSVVKVESEHQYANMKRFIPPGAPGLKWLEQAIRETGLEPAYMYIRGGTDGARLSALGIPTPNVFTGGHNFHSRYEWVPLSAMSRAARTIIHLVQLWAADAEQS